MKDLRFSGCMTPFWLGFTFLLGLAGCATYEPLALKPGANELLSEPTRAALANAAAELKHPVLRPVTIDFGKPLTPEALAILAVASNPDLKAAHKKAGVANAQLLSAHLLPDPNVNLSFDRRLSGPEAASQILPLERLVVSSNKPQTWAISPKLARMLFGRTSATMNSPSSVSTN